MSALRMTTLAVALALLLAPATDAGIIYQDDFSGEAVDLNGTAPDIGASNWVAGESFDADGSIVTAGTGGSATLAFTPVDGRIYALDASFTGVTGDSSWLGLGFAAGQSMAEGTSNRFVNNNVIGKAWMFHRGNANLQTNNAFLGTATSGAAAGNGAVFNPPFNGGGAIDLRVVLDTTGGTGAWTATWFAKLPTDASYSEVRPEAMLLDETINSVGIAYSSTNVEGNITSFKLAIVPEPSAVVAMLLGCTALVTGKIRRKPRRRDAA